MSRLKERIARIREEIPIATVLAHYGYRVRDDGGEREQQFPCDLHGDGQDNTPSARAYDDHWNCVSIETPILTSDGWVPLGELRRRLPVLSEGGRWETFTRHLDKGVRPVVRVETIEGYELICTEDHRIFTPGGKEVLAGSLEKGQRISLLFPQEPLFPTGMELPFSVEDLNGPVPSGNTLNLPSVWSENLGVALGYIFGDGWVTLRSKPYSHMVGITSHISDALEIRPVLDFLKGLVGGGGSEVIRRDKAVCGGKEYKQNQLVWTVGSNQFAEFWLRLGLNKQLPADQRGVPDALWGAPECAVRGFLRGVFAADGSVFRKKGRNQAVVSLYSVSEPFLKGVQRLLLQFGVRCRIYDPPAEKSRRTRHLQITAGPDVTRFLQRIGDRKSVV